MARVLFDVGVVGQHVATVLSMFGLAALYYKPGSCLFVDAALINFGLGCLRLATVLSTFGLVALRLGCISFICQRGIVYFWFGRPTCG